jgi:hypothetical protein
MNDVTREPAYVAALGEAMSLPTFVLRLWERRAARRVAAGRQGRGEVARLVAVCTVLNGRKSR